MNYVHIVAVLAVLQFFLFGILVGRARARHGVKPPATSGHDLFERAFRVHMNTLEQLVGFLPALLIACLAASYTGSCILQTRPSVVPDSC